MRSIREILRQKWELGRSNRTVARSVGVSVGAVGGMLHRARTAGLTTWAAVAPLSDDALAAAIYRRAAGTGRGRPHPDFALHNAKPMRHYGGASRRDLFERLDRPALRPLPATDFEYAEWKRARVNVDYHVAVDHHAYSVPHTLRQDEATVEVRLTARAVEIFHRGQRVAVHQRHYGPGFTTIAAHMPKAHQRHRDWSPSRFLRWATTIGPQTAALVAAILADRPHPEQGYRSCLGILRLAKRYDPARLEAACARALAAGARSYRHVDAILKRGLDRTPPLPAAEPPSAPVAHENLRGPDYYH